MKVTSLEELQSQIIKPFLDEIEGYKTDIDFVINCKTMSIPTKKSIVENSEEMITSLEDKIQEIKETFAKISHLKIVPDLNQVSKGKILDMIYGENVNGIDCAMPQSLFDDLRLKGFKETGYWIAYSYNPIHNNGVLGTPINLAQDFLHKFVFEDWEEYIEKQYNTK